MPEVKTQAELLNLGHPLDDSDWNPKAMSGADSNETLKKVWKRDDALVVLQRIMPELQLRYGVTHIALFGSVARDEAKPGSDLDILVHLKTPDLLIMGAVLNELENVFGCKVDLIRWREELGPLFQAELQRDLLYAN